jgi:uncharacterized protein (TIGR02996 family)
VESNLLAAIRADPDDLTPRFVYADLLQQRGDPRGELIALQLGARSTSDPERLHRRERELITQIEASLVRPEGTRLHWRLGFVDVLDVTGVKDARPGGWIDQPALAMVRHLRLLGVHRRNAINEWLEAPINRTVRKLVVGARSKPFRDITIRRIVEVLPDLEQLTIVSNRLPSLDPVSRLPLRALELYGRELAPADLTEVVYSLPLEHLIVDLQSSRIDLEALEPVLSRNALPELIELGILNATFFPALIDALAESSLLPRLRSLAIYPIDPMYDVLTRRDYHPVRSYRHAFAHLEIMSCDGDDRLRRQIESFGEQWGRRAPPW